MQEILDERASRYGSFCENSRISQVLKNTVALAKNPKAESFHIEGIEMILHKISRIAAGDPNYDDSWIDIAGYATRVVEIIHSRSKPQ